MGTKIIVTIEDDLHVAVKNQSKKTGVAYSFVVRRALENWVITGIVPARVSVNGEDRRPDQEPIPPETRASHP